MYVVALERRSVVTEGIARLVQCALGDHRAQVLHLGGHRAAYVPASDRKETGVSVRLKTDAMVCVGGEWVGSGEYLDACAGRTNLHVALNAVC